MAENQKMYITVIGPKPIQSNPWINPIHGHLCIRNKPAMAQNCTSSTVQYPNWQQKCKPRYFIDRRKRLLGSNSPHPKIAGLSAAQNFSYSRSLRSSRCSSTKFCTETHHDHWPDNYKGRPNILDRKTSIFGPTLPHPSGGQPRTQNISHCHAITIRPQSPFFKRVSIIYFNCCSGLWNICHVDWQQQGITPYPHLLTNESEGLSIVIVYYRLPQHMHFCN